MIELAVVAQVSPLLVRVKGSATSVAVQRRIQPNATGLAIGERVVVTVLDGQLTYMGRWDPA